MIMLTAVLMALLQARASTGQDCGSPPSVQLSCTKSGNILVNWSANVCKRDCDGEWSCYSGANMSKNGILDTSDGCPSSWSFNVPWDHYFCSVEMSYLYIQNFEHKSSSGSIRNCSVNSVHLRNVDFNDSSVGDSHKVQCILYTGLLIDSSNVNISWIGPNGDIQGNNRTIVTPTVSSNYHHTIASTLNFTYLSEEDEGSYRCIAQIAEAQTYETAPVQQYVNFSIHGLYIPPPVVHLMNATEPSTVGDTMSLKCNVTTVKGITSNVDIVWLADTREVYINQNIQPLAIDNSSNQMYTSNYSVKLTSGDNKREYRCQAVINGSISNKSAESFQISITIPSPEVAVTVIENRTVDGLLSVLLRCHVTIVDGISDTIDIVWMANGSEVKNITCLQVGNKYTSECWFQNVTHDGSKYECKATINSDPPSSSTDSYNYTLSASPTPSPTPSPTTPIVLVNSEDSPVIAAITISSIVAIVTIVFIICFIGIVVHKRKRPSRHQRDYSQQQYTVEQSINGTISYSMFGKGETSTIDYEYLKKHNNVEKWINNIEMPTLDEDRSSIHSGSTTSEKMLELVVHGTATKSPSKHNKGYCSGCSETMSNHDGTYVAESTAFLPDTRQDCETTFNDNKPQETTPGHNATSVSTCTSEYVAIGSQYQRSYVSHDGIPQDHTVAPTCCEESTSFHVTSISVNQSPSALEGTYSHDSTTVEAMMSETEENHALPMSMESNGSPCSTPRYQNTSLATSLESKVGLSNSTQLSEGDCLLYTSSAPKLNENPKSHLPTEPEGGYLPYNAAINSSDTLSHTEENTKEYHKSSLQTESEGGYFPYNSAAINEHASSDTLPHIDEKMNENNNNSLRTVSDHEEGYFPYNTAINQYAPTDTSSHTGENTNENHNISSQTKPDHDIGSLPYNTTINEHVSTDTLPATMEENERMHSPIIFEAEYLPYSIATSQITGTGNSVTTVQKKDNSGLKLLTRKETPTGYIDESSLFDIDIANDKVSSA